MRTSAAGLCFIAACAFAPGCSCSGSPPISCEVSDTCPPYSLSAPVEIVRDRDGIVHVYAETDADAFYGAGYMQAVDRLFQMDVMRRQVYGRRAEVLGEDYVDDDTLIRKLDVARFGALQADDMRSNERATYELVDAWVTGVNARIDELANDPTLLPLGFQKLGYQPEKWTPDDAMAVGKTIVFQNANQLEFDLLATLIQKYQPALFESLPAYSPLVDEFIVADDTLPPPPPSPAPPVPSPAPPDAGARLEKMFSRLAVLRPGHSNNWGVGAELTENKRPLLAGDPHQGLHSPSLMWNVHMSSVDAGGSLDVIGWTFVGTPGVSLGHNRRLAWTATTNYPDVTDLWTVQVVDGAAMIGGEPVAIETREEEIVVKGSDPVPLTVEIVPGYGALLPEDLSPLPVGDVAGARLLLNWTGYRVTHEAPAFFAIDRAQTLDEFDAAVDRMELGSFNFVAATETDVSYRSSPLVPDRGDPSTAAPSYVVLDGSDPATFWTGKWLSGDQLPNLRPKRDEMVVSANNDPFGFSSDGDLSNDPFYFGAYFDPGTRAGRAHQRLLELAAQGPLTVADMQAVQLDSASLLAGEVLPMLAEAWAKVPTDESLAAFRDRPELEALVTMLADWDQHMTRDKTAPVAFEALLHFFAVGVIGDDMDFFFYPVLENSPIYGLKFALLATRQPGQALLQEGQDLLILNALAATADLMIERYGAVDGGVTWRDYHVSTFNSESIPEYDGGFLPTDGAEGTVSVSEGRFFSGSDPADNHVSRSGAIYRMVATFGEDGTPEAYFTMPRGSSEDPESELFDNLTEAWADGEYRQLRFERADVNDGALESFVIEP